MIYNATNEKDQRADVPSYVKGKKVIDVGGAMHHWLDPKPFACVDIQKGDCKVNFMGDINMPLVWAEVGDYVDEHGKFDFAVCTHVLEDIRNPPLVLEMLPLIAKEGFISMPNKYWELGYVENTNPDHIRDAGLIPGPNKYTYRGFHHHRWICTVKDDTLWLFPKLNFIGYIDRMPWLPETEKGTRDENFHELSFWWAENVPYKIINDDFLGPNPNVVFEFYRSQLEKGI